MAERTERIEKFSDNLADHDSIFAIAWTDDKDAEEPVADSSGLIDLCNTSLTATVAVIINRLCEVINANADTELEKRAFAFASACTMYNDVTGKELDRKQVKQIADIFMDGAKPTEPTS